MISDIQSDAIKELINIGVGRTAHLLNSMLESHIELEVPEVLFLKQSELLNFLYANGDSTSISTVSLAFKGNLQGNAKLVFTTDSASKLVNAFMNEALEETDMDSIRIGTLTEVGNIVLNTLVGVLCNTLQMHLIYSVPNFEEGSVAQLIQGTSQYNAEVMYARTSFFIHDLDIHGDFVLFFELGGFDNLLNHIDEYINNTLTE